MPPNAGFRFDNSYARKLDGFYVPWKGDAVPEPRIVALNRPLAAELGLDADALDTPEGAAIFAGSKAPEGAAPLAQVYAGHQFGGFSPQLGDGRALLIGEVIDREGRRRDIHLKGSGRTPFSRGGDGKAVLGPVLREYLMGEAMHALGIPTTRALAAVTTGERIVRDGPEPGAVLARVAASHLRVGTFQFFAARGDVEAVQQLADYAIDRHDPSLAGREDRYIAFLRGVIARQARLVSGWMGIGFIHGVMNTDNTTISGETIDYGPCAFMDAYQPATVFSSIDQGGRYAYGNQPGILQWNLARFAETLLPLLADKTERAIEIATAEVNAYPDLYTAARLDVFRAKLGLSRSEDGNGALIDGFLDVLEESKTDFTRAFRALAQAAGGDDAPLRSVCRDTPECAEWLRHWRARIDREEREAAALAAAIEAVNPVYIPRNHLVDEALKAATDGDLDPFRALLQVVGQPFTERDGFARFAAPAPEDFGPFVTYCGT